MKKFKTLTNLKTSSANNTEDKAIQLPEGLSASVAIGDPECPFCHGLGFIAPDVDRDDPRFGKLQICTCRAQESSLAGQSELVDHSNLGALRGLTFDNFHPRGRVGIGQNQADSLEQAYNTAKQFAQSRSGWLLMTGHYGSGKTHLAAAIANQALDHGISALFLTVPDLLDWLRGAYGSQASFEDRFDNIRNISLLVLDDFGTQNATAWAQEKLFQILNHRYVNKLTTVVTSNNEVDDFEGRIRSRLLDPELVMRVELNVPDYRNPMDEVGHPELSSLALHGKMRFENFELRTNEGLNREEVQALSEAFNAAKDFAKHPEGWIVFYGPYAVGKTHLAAAIGNAQATLGNPPLMVSVPDLLDHLRSSFNPNSNVRMDRRFEEIKNARLLILDDLGMQSATPWASEKLYQLFNYRYVSELPTVVTTSLTYKELDQRIYSRLADGRICKNCVMYAPAYTLKFSKTKR